MYRFAELEADNWKHRSNYTVTLSFRNRVNSSCTVLHSTNREFRE